MKNYNLNIQNYLMSGFYIGNSEVNNNKIQYLRELILKNLKTSNKEKIMTFVDFNEELQSETINLLGSNFIKNFIRELKFNLNIDISVLPKIHVMKNYHVNRLKTAGIGWHRDCAGEFRHRYCNNLLSKSEYVFGKIGIYLQENSEALGGGIDLIPKSHYYIKNKNYFKRKISGIRLKLLYIIQKSFPSLYKLISENSYIKFLKAIKVKANPGDPVFFDSRVIHRGSPIKDSLVNSFAELDNIHYEVPDKDAKISIYCEYGSSVGVESTLYDRKTREEYAGELEIWLKEIELYKKYSPELHSLALDIIHNANLNNLEKQKSN
jgi:hypothetical protein